MVAQNVDAKSLSEYQYKASMSSMFGNQPWEDTSSKCTICQPLRNFQKDQSRNTASQSEIERSLKTNSGLGERFITTYQLTHCTVFPSSPPKDGLDAKQVSTQEPKPCNFNRKIRVTQVMDSFAESLRKYPATLPKLTCSSELIDRLISATLTKRISISKKVHPVRGKKKCLSDTRSKRVTANRKTTRHFSHVIASNVEATSSTKLGETAPSKELRSSGLSPYEQRMGRGTEVRYLNDVRKYIQDAIKYVWNEDVTVCPKIERRYEMHQQECHKYMKEMDCDKLCYNSEGQLNEKLASVEGEQSTCQVKKGSNTCFSCNKPLPCQCPVKLVKKLEDSQKEILKPTSRCHRTTSQDTVTLAPSSKTCEKKQLPLPCQCSVKIVKNTQEDFQEEILKPSSRCHQTTSLEDTITSAPFCHTCKKEQAYYNQVLKQVLDWQQEIPLNADCTNEDKVKRHILIRKLVKSLLKFKGMEDKQTEEIKRCLAAMPMWQPVNHCDRDILINNLLKSLLVRIKLLNDQENGLKQVVNDWIDKDLFNGTLPQTIDKDVILNKLMVLIKSLELDNLSNRCNYDETLRSHLIDLLKKNRVQDTNVDFLNKSADKLLLKINNMPPNNGDIFENKHENGANNLSQDIPKTSKTIVDVNMSKSLDINFDNNVHYKSTESKIKDEIKKIIEITRNNRLDSRTESLLMEAFIMKLKALSMPSISNSEPINQHTRNQTNNNFIQNQTVQEIIDEKVRQILEQLPLNIGHKVKTVLKDDIIDVISKNLAICQTYSKEHFDYNLQNKDRNLAGLSSAKSTESEFPNLLIEDIQNDIRGRVTSFFKKYEGYVRNKKIRSDLANIMADQIITQDNDGIFKEKVHSLLKTVNLSESKFDELYNTLLQHTNDMSLSFKNKISPLFRDEMTKKQEEQSTSKRTEKEIINFIRNYHKKFDEKFMLSIKRLAEEIDNIISNLKHFTRETEDILVKPVNKFLENEGVSTGETSKNIAKDFVNRLINIPVESTTTRIPENESIYSHDSSPIQKENEGSKTLPQSSLVQIYENPTLNDISHEIIKYIEKIPTDRLISQNKNYHKIVAKEIAQRIRVTAKENPEIAEQAVVQLLSKLIKNPSETELSCMLTDLKKITEEKDVRDLSSRLSRPSVPRYECASNGQVPNALKKGIMDWLRKSPLYQKRNMPERLFQENLVSELANDLNCILNKDGSNLNEELILKSIESRIKQFPMEPKLKCDSKYHQNLSLEILKYLKDTQILKKNKNTSTSPSPENFLRRSEEIPLHHIISNDKEYPKATANEISQQVQEVTDQSQDTDLVVDQSTQRWLPKIVKSPDETKLHKNITNKDTSTNVLPRDSDSKLFDILKYDLMRWLKNKPVYVRRNTQEKLHQEHLMTSLAVDLDRIVNNSTNNEFDKKYLLKAIESHLKQLPLDPSVKHSDTYHYKMAIELLNYITDSPPGRNVLFGKGEVKDRINSWIQSLPLSSKNKSQDTINAADRIYSIVSEFMDNKLEFDDRDKNLKNKIIDVLKDLPLSLDISNVDKLQILLSNLLETLKYGLKDNNMRFDSSDYSNFDKTTENSLLKEIALRCENLPINLGDNPRDIRKIKENLFKGLFTMINNHALIDDDNIYREMMKEIDQLINKLSVNAFYTSNLNSLKKYLFDIAIELSKTKRKEFAKNKNKKQLYEAIDSTLPTSSNLSYEQQRSFDDMKEKLVEAFITLLETTNGRYKENINKEINKFCNEYLKKYPATPIGKEKLCEDLFTALRNVPLIESKLNNTDIERSKTKDNIERCLAEFPFADTEENNFLKKQFVSFLLNFLYDQKNLQNKNLEDIIMEKLEQFSFEPQCKYTIEQLTRYVIKTLQLNDYQTSHQKPRERLLRERRTSQEKDDEIRYNMDRQKTGAQSKHIYDLSSDHIDIPNNFRESVRDSQSSSRYQNKTAKNGIYMKPVSNKIDDGIDRRRNNSSFDTLMSSKYRRCLSKEDSITTNARTNSFNGLDYEVPLMHYTKPKSAQTANQCDLSPHIIVKEYYWDSTSSEMVDSHHVLPNTHSELRRTVPSLPLTQIEQPTRHCRSTRRLCIQSPCLSHISMIEPHVTTLSIPINQQSVEEEEFWATRNSPTNTRYSDRQSKINLSRSIDRSENFITRSTSSYKTERPNFHNNQSTSCNNRIEDERRCNNDYCWTREAKEYENVRRSDISDFTNDVKFALEQERDDDKSCECFGRDYKKSLGGQTSGSKRMVNHQCQGNSNNCINCRDGLRLCPSYIYYN